MKIGIVGFGRFGSYLGRLFRETTFGEFRFYDPSISRLAEPCWRWKVDSLKELCKFSKYIVLCVPMRKMKDALKEIAPFITEDHVVIDTCSLKVLPLEWMHEVLPPCTIIGCHPLFGPQSAPIDKGLKGCKIVFCHADDSDFPVFLDFVQKINKPLKGLGIQPLMCSSWYHDKQMAISQAITHFVGCVMDNMGIGEIELSTKSFDDMMDIVNLVNGGSQELFEDMQNLNPYAAEMRKNFINATIELNGKIEQLKK